MPRKSRVFGIVGMAAVFALFGSTISRNAGAQDQVKPRILLIFDTSGSMVWNVGPGGEMNRSYGDGSWDPWTDNTFCCPGRGNSRIFHAKEAVRQMVFATGDIEFALMKFVQEYMDGPGGTSSDFLYYGNQAADQLDTLTYQAHASCEWPASSGNIHEFAPYGTADDIKWLCAEFPESGGDSRGAVMMWMDHHQYSSTNLGTVDDAPVDDWSRAGDGLEQELRAIGATPIANSLYAAQDYLSAVYNTDYAANSDTAECRPYSVILLTDGDETCGGTPSEAAEALHSLEHASGDKNVNIWVIGFAYQGNDTTLNTIASIGGTTYARTATNVTELSGVLYEIVSDSLLVEICNDVDDDCDGLIDEGFEKYCNYWEGSNSDCGADGTQTADETFCDRPSECACDGIDNNCDGVTDELPDGETSWPMYPNSCGGCDETVAGQEYCTDPNEGRCDQGNLVCSPGVGYECLGAVNPVAESCNNLDDDCDGLTDEDIVGDSCGVCGDGIWICNDGKTSCCGAGSTATDCIPILTPSIEICNSEDDDCDGLTDEDVTQSCGGCDDETCDDPDEGVCAQGQAVCTLGEWSECTGEISPTDEICDTLDNDCDGLTDEDIVGEPCGTCDDGHWHCINGGEQCCAGVDTEGNCLAVQTPSSESCDGIDNDCDGLTDEELSPRNCDDTGFEDAVGVGVCNVGYQICMNGEWGNLNPQSGEWETDYCLGRQEPTDEICDGLDNDCDGETDEGLGTTPGCGPCGDGQEECIGGFLQCIGATAPEEEICNAYDDNCNGLTDEGITTPCGGCAIPEDLDVDAGIPEEYEEYEDCLAAQEADTAIGPGEGECQEGAMYCDPDETDLFGDCQGGIGPSPELCDAKDNDCDGQVDEEEDIEGVNEQCATEVGLCEDGWWRCVDNEDGSKSLECCAEVTEDNLCVPPTQPEEEVCDGLDNDCDGEIDEELPNAGESCGQGLGVCQAGTYECICEIEGDPTSCEMTCTGSSEGSDEKCNALDDDCDGETDEDLPIGAECTNAPGGVATGECNSGNKECINGKWVCNANEPTDEICDGRDNDCDGSTDEDLAVECPENSVCIEGECTRICAGEELQCPAGLACTPVADNTGREIRVCIPAVCQEGSELALPCVENKYWCDEGYEPLCKCSQAQQKCVSICEDILCPDGMTCISSLGQCQPIGDDCYASGCPTGELCRGGECVDDPCQDECPQGEYCNYDGDCVKPCVGIICPVRCFEGACVDPCEDVTCEDDEVCNDVTGECEAADVCKNVQCKYYEICQGGECIEDPCYTITCPNGYYCQYGSCMAFVDLTGTDTEGYGTDTNADDGTDSAKNGSDDSDTGNTTGYGMDRVLATGMGGCLCHAVPGAPTNPNAWWLGLVAILALAIRAVWQRKHRMNWYLATLWILAAFALFGCETEPYVLANENTNDSTDNSNRSTSNEETDDISGSDSSNNNGECDPDNADDDCDGVDDDCDGETDEGVDLQTNSEFCGDCDNDCRELYANAFGLCEDGTCKMGDCSPSYHDMNGKDEDGCEYYCTYRSETDLCNGVDLGDGSYQGMDDDCDGETDEEDDLNLQTDPSNCGRCGNVCHIANANVRCEDGACVFDSATDCNEDFHDINGKAEDGCEYACTKTADEEELCDKKDDDCDGETDEGSPEGGGTCYELESGCTVSDEGEINCPESSRCQAGVWTCKNGALVCDGQVGPSPTESCNGIDDNCNGEVDENLIQSCTTGGDDFQEIGVCRKGYRLCKDGAYDLDTCEEEMLASDEVCDGLDNDCDGLTDEGEDNGPLVEGTCGQCGGLQFCISGQKYCCLALDEEGECIEPQAATTETCNGFDDDCDGITDNNLTPVLCDGDDADLCKEGMMSCIDGVLTCTDDTGDNPEVCDGLDNDCDGYTDTDDDALQDPAEGFCRESCGEALLGVQCMGTAGWLCQYDCDAVQCNAFDQVVINETLCDGIDNDCDGETDENLQATAENCGGCGNDCYDVAGENFVTLVCASGECKVSECQAGYYNLDGDLSCEYGPCTPTGEEGSECDGVDNNCNGYTDEGIAAPEVCDGVDNDCNGLTDDFQVMPDICNTQCPSGSYDVVCDPDNGWKCQYDCDVLDCVDGDSTTVSNEAESKCDGVDNNCDGTTDEGFLLWTDQETTYGALCVSEGIGGCSKVGRVRCSEDQASYVCCSVDDAAVCAAEYIIPKTPSAEVETGSAADGVDNDCDGTVDDGADGCIEKVSITGPDGSFEIFKYEASKRVDGQQAPCSEAQAEGTPPWTNLSFENARDACLRLNDNEGACSYDDPDSNAAECWDLCTAEQWYYACAYGAPTDSAPHLYPYGDSYSENSCNGMDYTGDSAIAAGEASQCAATWNTDESIWDMSGNVEEWTLNQRSISSTTLRVIRGGSYKAFAGGLTCSFDFIAADELDFQMDQLGFRCCKGDNPISACQNSIDMISGHPFTFDVPGDTTRCEADTWWVDSVLEDDWRLGKTNHPEVDNTTCVFGTVLNGYYSSNQDNYLYSSPIDLSSCEGESINLTWNMYFANADDTGDYIYLQQRTSSDNGENWGSWSTIGSNINSATAMSDTQTRTISSSVPSNATYQFRFVFHTDGDTGDLGAYLDNLKFVIN